MNSVSQLPSQHFSPTGSDQRVGLNDTQSRISQGPERWLNQIPSLEMLSKRGSWQRKLKVCDIQRRWWSSLGLLGTEVTGWRRGIQNRRRVLVSWEQENSTCRKTWVPGVTTCPPEGNGQWLAKGRQAPLSQKWPLQFWGGPILASQIGVLFTAPIPTPPPPRHTYLPNI